MPRNHYERKEPDYRARHRLESPERSPKRRKRSRSREKYRHSSNQRSPTLLNSRSQDKKRNEQNGELNNRSYKPEEVRWKKDDSISGSDEERDKVKFKRNERKSRQNMQIGHECYKEEELHRHATENLKLEKEEKQGPNMALSGKLTEETNTFNGITVKYSEPPEARKPKRRWRFYVFKGDEAMPVLHLHRQSAYLLGKDRKVADIPIDHPSCSRQHAVFQYRCIPGINADGQKISRVLPYIIDLESSNGTFVNNQKIEPKRYLELREKDVLKFGFSSREYVLLHEQSDNGLDDGQ